LTWVLAYCGNCWWNSATTLFIQVTWAGTEEPIRQTVIVAGAGADDAEAVAVDVEVAVLLLLDALELQPAIASAAAATPAAAPIAADLFLSPTAGTPSARVNTLRSNLLCDLAQKTNWKLSYKIGLLQDLNNG
jgi:hypothetical protein